MFSTIISLGVWPVIKQSESPCEIKKMAVGGMCACYELRCGLEEGV